MACISTCGWLRHLQHRAWYVFKSAVATQEHQGGGQNAASRVLCFPVSEALSLERGSPQHSPPSCAVSAR